MARGAARADAWTRGCKRSSADACLSLAIEKQYGGTGIAEDRAEAARLYRAACDGGRAQGCHSLGQMLAKGDGVPADRPRARELYLRACAGGFSDACAGMVWHAGDYTRFDDARDGLEQMRARCVADRVECMELRAAVKDLKADAGLIGRLEAACTKKETAACRTRELLDGPIP
jgi:TPR repeat protein